MADFLKEAIEMVKAQASLKEMTPEQTMDLVKKYQQSFLTLANVENKDLLSGSIISGGATALPESEKQIELILDPKVALKKGQPDLITCAICGFQAKALARHLSSTHGIDAKEYRRICGYPSGTKLTAKAFSEARSEWAKENKPYEKSARYQKSQENKASEGSSTDAPASTDVKPEKAKKGKADAKVEEAQA